ncbi:MAG TPA: hypothetical protein VMU83_24320 [Hanamia sp.]|nr:hypothetical protein [Hanamia sp.]
MAQTDTTIHKGNEDHIDHKKTFMGKMINNFKKDTAQVDVSGQLRRNEEAFNKYDGLIIRNIYIERFPFGFTIGDTSRRFSNSITKIANYLHHLTKIRIIRKNLFFKEGQKLKPYLMADNETYLRQLLYLQDAEIKAIPLAPGSDSIDILVEVKDVFSLGGAINSLGIKQTNIQFREDNFAGTGNAGIVNGLYDDTRKNNFAFGGEYDSRNIGGSFIDGRIGYQSSYPTFNGFKEENNYYINLVKPLVNRYMKWTYELDASYHSTRNLYTGDSVYLSNIRYRYSNFEGWAGYNINWKDFTEEEESQKLRKLIGARIINEKFQELPGLYKNAYNWQYADLSGVLATLTFYRQNFYKTQYIYGFGRNEDIPEGLLMSITSGYTIKDNKSRPYLGFTYQHYRFNSKENYLSYTISAEGNLDHKTIEDINLLASVAYFDHLKKIGTKWKQRFFLNLDLAQQVNTVLNEPLFANSQFGLPEYGNDRINNQPVGGNLRGTVKAESEFFSPWSLVAFKFAPFVFGDASVFSPYLSDTKLLTSVGGGIRTRNESFVFGTIEFKGYYFPQKNFSNKSFDFELSTNVIFKYNTQIIRKPNFILVN